MNKLTSEGLKTEFWCHSMENWTNSWKMRSCDPICDNFQDKAEEKQRGRLQMRFGAIGRSKLAEITRCVNENKKERSGTVCRKGAGIWRLISRGVVRFIALFDLIKAREQFTRMNPFRGSRIVRYTDLRYHRDHFQTFSHHVYKCSTHWSLHHLGHLECEASGFKVIGVLRCFGLVMRFAI